MARAKGIANRKTLYLSEELKRLGIDPVVGIKEALDSLPPKEKVQVFLKLLDFLYPKRKAVELSGELKTEIISHKMIMEYIEKDKF